MKNWLLIFSISLISFSYGGAELETAWEYFAENKYNVAVEKFEVALSNTNDKAAAYRGLSLAHNMLGNDEKSFEAFYNYYKCNSADRDFYIDAMWSLYGEVLSDTQLDYLEQILEESKNGKFKALSNFALAQHLFLTKKYSKAIPYFDKIGSVKDWKLVGEFENISESGFDKDFGALDHPEAEHVFKNKKGAEVKWFDMQTSPYQPWLDMEMHFYASNSIIYAQNFCYSPVDQEVQFRLGTSGSIKFWVNDKKLFEESEERNNGIDTYIFTAKLNKGYNRLLLQIGESEVGSCNFLLRITDDNGNPIQGLTYSKKVQEYAKDYNYESKLIDDKTEKFFLDKLTANPDDLESYLILNQYYLLNERTHKAQRVLKKARVKFPTCTYVQLQLINSYANDDNSTEVSTLLEFIKKNDKENLIVQNLFFKEAMDIEDYDEAEEILDRMVMDLGSKNPMVLLKRIELAGARDQVETIIKYVNQGYSLYPLNPSFVKLKALIYEKVQKNRYMAAKTKEQYVKKRHNMDMSWQLVWYYFDVNNQAKAMKIYDKIMEVNPTATGYYRRMAGIKMQMSNYSSSREYSEKAIKIAPYIGSYYSDIADTYKESGASALATDFYQQALNYNPYDYDSRGKLDELAGRPIVFERFFQEANVDSLYENAPNEDKYPEDNSLVLLDQVQKVVYDGGGSVEKHTFMVKVFNESGVEDWKEYYLPVYSNQSGTVEKIEVYKKNGSKLEAERNGTHVVFPNLEPGDAIFIRFKLENYYSGKLADHFWDQHYFTYFYPIAKSQYQMAVENNKEFKYEISNSNMQPAIKDVDSYKVYKWEVENVPSVKQESYMPNLVDVGQVLSVSSIPNWDFVSDWYADLAQSKSKTDFLVEETAKELFEGKEDLSVMDKVKLVYDYITQNIQYISVSFIQSGLIPQKASKVIASKQGDCKDVSTLFVALCKTQGIDANLVLVNTKDNGLGDMPLPSISFNHCIAHVIVDSKDYFLELTSNNVPFAAGEYSLKNAFTLQIPKDASEVTDAVVINPDTRQLSHIVRNSKVRFEGDKMTVEKNTIRSGLMAAYSRNTYRDLGEEKTFKTMQEAISGVYPSIDLLDVKFNKGLDSNSSELHYFYSYEVPSVFTEIGGMQILKLPWADNHTEFSFTSLKEREYPILIWKYFNAEESSETLEIEIPAGSTLTELPANEKYENDYFKYSLTFKKEGSKLIAKRVFSYLEDSIPVADYQANKEMLAKILKADGKQIAFKK